MSSSTRLWFAEFSVLPTFSYTKCFDGVIVEVQVSCKVNANNAASCSQYFSEVRKLCLEFSGSVLSQLCEAFYNIQLKIWRKILRRSLVDQKLFSFLPHVVLSQTSLVRWFQNLDPTGPWPCHLSLGWRINPTTLFPNGTVRWTRSLLIKLTLCFGLHKT